MNANHCHDIDDTSPETFRLLSDLIEASRTDEQMIYREAEIDELWRLLVAYQKRAEGAAAQDLAAIIAWVMEVHDMLEVTADAPIAAGKLRELANQVGHYA